MNFHNQTSKKNQFVSSIFNKGKKNNKDFEIVCAYNSNLRFEKMSDDFTYHLIECDNCLKELLLFQARKIKEEKRHLNEKLNNKKIIIRDLNNSMNNHSNNINIKNSKDELENDSNSENSLISN